MSAVVPVRTSVDLLLGYQHRAGPFALPQERRGRRSSRTTSTDVLVAYPGDDGAFSPLAPVALRRRASNAHAAIDSFRHGSAASWILRSLTVAAVLSWAIWLRPPFLAGSTEYIFVSGDSMEPTLSHGDLVVTRTKGSYGPGDVVAYRVPEDNVGAGALVIHRITGFQEDGKYILRGDNRQLADLWHPTADDVIGAQWFRLPFGGVVLSLIGTPLVLGLASGVAVFIFIVRPPARSQRPPERESTDIDR